MSATVPLPTNEVKYEKVMMKLPKSDFDLFMKNFTAYSEDNQRQTGQPLFKTNWFGEQFMKGQQAVRKLRFFDNANVKANISVESDEVIEDKKEEKTEEVIIPEIVEEKQTNNWPYILFFAVLLILLAIFLYLKYRPR